MSLIDLLGGASVAVPSNGAWTPLYGLNRVFIGYVFVELGERWLRRPSEVKTKSHAERNWDWSSDSTQVLLNTNHSLTSLVCQLIMVVMLM